MNCEVSRLTPEQDCAQAASYALTISYLGRPALTVHLCRLHTLDTWHLAQAESEIMYGRAGHVKSVAVKKLE